MKIIVDMMGGDNAPLAVLEGAAQAVKEYGVQLIGVGNEALVRKIAAEHPELAEKLTSVFIAPGSIDELRRRLKGRATESDADIDRRMKTAEYEFRQADKFDRRIDSGTKDEDYAALKKIYLELKSGK